MITNQVLKLRKQRRLSQQALADALGVTRQTINAVENLRVIPSLPIAFKIARYFELAVDEIFALDD